MSVVFSGYFSGNTHADFNVPTRNGLFHVTEDSFVSLVKQLNNKNNVCKPWCLLLLFVALSLLSQSWFRELPNDNGNSIENVKKAKGLYKQKKLCKFITLYGTFLCDVVNVNRRRRFSQFLSLNIDTIIKNPTPIQAPVVQTLDSAIHRITNHYALDGAIGFPNTYPLDSDLSGG